MWCAVQVQAVLGASTWPQVMAFWGLGGTAALGPAALTYKLRRAWDRSLAMGYHKAGMDFTKVQVHIRMYI